MAPEEEERRIVVTARARLRAIDRLPEPERTLAIHGVPLADRPRMVDWIAEARGLIDGTLHRVWTGDRWTTERVP